MVKTIFEKFSKGEKTAAITDWLNASGIPCSFRTRIAEANRRRINKGIAPAKYKQGNVDNMIWRTTTVNRIVKNKVYIGVNKIFEQRAFNRNQSIRHGNLLKTLLRCGECGSRFCAVTLPKGSNIQRV